MKFAATRALFAYWDRLRAGRAAPERSDLDPGAIRTLLGDVFLLEAHPGADHQVRLAGTRICSLLGHEWRGHAFSAPFAANGWADMQALLESVSSEAIPVVAGIRGETRDGRQIDLEMLLLPLRHRGRTHARLLGSLVCENWPFWAGSVPVVRFHLVSVRHLATGEPAAPGAALSAPPPRVPAAPLRLLPGGGA